MLVVYDFIWKWRVIIIIRKNITEKDKSKAIKIRSIQANSLWAYNNEFENAYLDIGKAVINDSLFSEYMLKHGAVANKKRKSNDFIVMKFDYGVKKCEKCKDGMSAQELRDYYYKNGATVPIRLYDKEGNVVKEDTIHYKMLMRNPGKAKKGDCIFVCEKLYLIALRYITMNLWDKMPLENTNIVGMSAYAPLTTATSIGYIKIPMENILIVEDKKVETMVNAVTVKTHYVPHEISVVDWDAVENYINKLGMTFYKKKIKDNPYLQYVKKSKKALIGAGVDIGEYPTKIKTIQELQCCVERSDEKQKVENVLWDGEGLIDESIFPKDMGMDGFIYCRNHFFKSCLFRGNLQQYFKDFYGDDYETATVIDMFGNVFKVTDIKVIITENSIKWIKFKELMGSSDIEAYQYYDKFLKEHDEIFAIVKTAHPSKWGDLQRSSYQINNSLPCIDEAVLGNIAELSITYCNSLKLSHEAFMNHLRITASKRHSINNVLIALDEWNENFKRTDYFKEKKKKIISEFKNERLKLGKLLQYGDNLTICGNPMALLMKVTGHNFLEEKCFEQIEDGIQCYTTRFSDGERLAAFRSPHNSPNNIVHLVNTFSDDMQRYFSNLGDNVVVVNGIGTDIQSRANGMDMDTDGFYVTNQPDIVEIARNAYRDYPTIINGIPLKGNSEYNRDMESYAKMDNKISSAQFAIGNASNIAQLALSYYFDGGSKSQELEDVFIICSVLAQVAIDGAKREYVIDVGKELYRLQNLSCMKPSDGKRYPKFYADIQKQKGNEVDESEIREFSCPMEILAKIIEEGVIDLRKHKKYNTSTYNLKTVFEYKADKIRDNKQYKKVISIVQEYDKTVKGLDETKEGYSKDVEREFDECMEKINKLSINKSTMSSLIAYAFSKNGDIRDRLLVALYDYDSEKFLGCFKKKSKTPSKIA